ncbi:hypothetical protein ACWGRF_02120 [Streptomyces zhihengii]
MAVPDAQMSLIIDGAPVDVTDHVRRAGRIKHRRGRREGAARVDPSSASFTIESPGGLYSNRNPRSPYFGKLGRNTPSVLTVAGPTYLSLPGAQGDYVSTPDVAALDITGDIDVRLDATLDRWADASPQFEHVDLIAKFSVAAAEKSWLFAIRAGRLFFEWSPTGASTLDATSTEVLPPAARRRAVRVTLDVNNGAGGRAVTFYTAPTMAGPWVQFGAPVVAAGTTSIQAGVFPVRIGDATPLAFGRATGQCHSAEIRNGINGTVVASPNFTAQPPGTTSFADSAGRTWTLNGRTAITDRHTRFHLAVPEWPPSWHVSGHNVTAALTAAGTLRRLGQGRKALDSPLRRRIAAAGPLAYWPMEDQGTAVSAASPIEGVTPMQVTNVDWGADTDLASSAPLPRLITSGVRSTMRGNVPAPAGTLSAYAVNWMYRMDTPPAPMRTFMRVMTSGTVREWHLNWNSATIRILALNADGGTILSADYLAPPEIYGRWMLAEFWVTQAGSAIDWHMGWIDVNRYGWQVDGTIAAATIGRPTAVASPAGGYGAELGGMSMGHVSVWPTPQNTGYYAAYGNGALDAWTREQAGQRVTRLAAEEGLAAPVTGMAALQQRMGPQHPAPLLDLLAECEATDGGVLYEDRGTTALVYRDRASMYNQPPALTVAYGELAPPLAPVDDDALIRNDVTRQRAGGSSARVVVETGPLSVLPPEDGGVGIYDESLTLSMHDDTQPLQIAGWAAHLGTWDEARYPAVTLYLHKHPELIEQVLALDVGDLLRITDLPDFLPPGPADLIVQGYEEEFDVHAWTITVYCTPAGPWRVLQLSAGERSRLATDGATLAAGVTAGATSLSVTSAGNRWVDSATYPSAFPMPIVVGGEEMTVTAITGTSSPQTFTVVRSTNGIVKSHDAGSPVQIAQTNALPL